MIRGELALQILVAFYLPPQHLDAWAGIYPHMVSVNENK